MKFSVVLPLVVAIFGTVALTAPVVSDKQKEVFDALVKGGIFEDSYDDELPPYSEKRALTLTDKQKAVLDALVQGGYLEDSYDDELPPYSANKRALDLTATQKEVLDTLVKGGFLEDSYDDELPPYSERNVPSASQ